VQTKFKVPKDERVSVGFWEAGRGWLIHHLHVDKGRIVNYQITTPSTINASPRDPFGQPGPYEQAIVDTPILESVADEDRQGHRCIAHDPQLRPMHAAVPRTWTPAAACIVREVNSCGCTLE
jgi:hydrogenase large subunit